MRCDIQNSQVSTVFACQFWSLVFVDNVCKWLICMYIAVIFDECIKENTRNWPKLGLWLLVME